MRFSSENMFAAFQENVWHEIGILCEIEAVIALAVGRFARISSIAFPK